MSERIKIGELCNEAQLVPVKLARTRWRRVVPEIKEPDLWICAARYMASTEKKLEDVECVRDVAMCPLNQMGQELPEVITPESGLPQIREFLTAPARVKAMITDGSFAVEGMKKARRG